MAKLTENQLRNWLESDKYMLSVKDYSTEEQLFKIPFSLAEISTEQISLLTLTAEPMTRQMRTVLFLVTQDRASHSL